MENNKRWILGLIVLILAIGALSYWGFKKSDTKETSSPQVSGATSEAAYFDDNASVMFFYSDYCGHCVAQKADLEKMAPEGYRVKPMNVGEHQDYWQQYNIEGTPTFVAKNGDRLVGHRDITELKAWLDQHK